MTFPLEFLRLTLRESRWWAENCVTSETHQIFIRKKRRKEKGEK